MERALYCIREYLSICIISKCWWHNTTLMRKHYKYIDIYEEILIQIWKSSILPWILSEDNAHILTTHFTAQPTNRKHSTKTSNEAPAAKTTKKTVYNVEEMYVCKFREIKKTNRELQWYIAMEVRRTVDKVETSRSPSWPFLFVKVEIWKICYSCYFCHICYSIFSHSKKNSSYFCDFCDICYFFYAFLIAVSFKSFLLKWRKQFAGKCLLTRSTLDISDKVKIMRPELIFGAAWSMPVAFHSSLAK